MAVITNDIVTRFAFQGSIAPLSQFNASLGGSLKLLAGMTAGLVGVAGATTAWVTSITKGNDKLIQLSRNTGVAIETIGELGFAASVTGSSTEALEGSIGSLSQKIGEAATRGSEDFARIGISVRDAAGNVKSADQVLLEFGKKTRGLSREQKLDFASKLGIDQSLIQLLSKSSGEIDTLRKEAIKLGRVNTEQADKMAAYNDSVTRFKAGLDGLKNQIAIGLIPVITNVAGKIADFVEGLDFSAIGASFKKGFDVVFQAIKDLAPFALAFVGHLALMKLSAIGFTGVLAGLKLALGHVVVFGIRAVAMMTALLSPVVLATAAVVAIGLAIQDVMTAFRGGESVIAGWYESLFQRDLVADLTAAFEIMKGAVEVILTPLKAMWDLVSNIAGGIAGFAAGAIGGIVDFVTGAPEITAPPIGGNVSNQNQNMTVNQGVQIDIRTDDPQAAGAAVNDALNTQLEDGFTQFGRGAR